MGLAVEPRGKARAQESNVWKRIGIIKCMEEKASAISTTTNIQDKILRNWVRCWLSTQWRALPSRGPTAGNLWDCFGGSFDDFVQTSHHPLPASLGMAPHLDGCYRLVSVAVSSPSSSCPGSPTEPRTRPTWRCPRAAPDRCCACYSGRQGFQWPQGATCCPNQELLQAVVVFHYPQMFQKQEIRPWANAGYSTQLSCNYTQTKGECQTKYFIHSSTNSENATPCNPAVRSKSESPVFMGAPSGSPVKPWNDAQLNGAEQRNTYSNTAKRLIEPPIASRW